MTNAPTRAQFIRLYRDYLSAASSFSSYNFRTYFLRRSRDLFRSNLLPASTASLSSPYSKISATTTPASPPTLLSPVSDALASSSSSGGDTASSHSTTTSGSGSTEAERLRAFYETAQRDLAVLRRSALTNRMYEGEKLVVEKPRIIVAGGGAGAEASVGGSGMPDQMEQGKGGAPPSG